MPGLPDLAAGFTLITRRDAQAARQTGAATVPSAETRIRTAHAADYLTRLCGHLSKLGSASKRPGPGPRRHASGGPPPAVLRAEHTGDTGTIILSWGQLTLRAAAGELIIRAAAGSPQDLQRIQDMTAGRLARLGRREHLDLRWTPVTGAPGEPGQPG